MIVFFQLTAFAQPTILPLDRDVPYHVVVNNMNDASSVNIYSGNPIDYQNLNAKIDALFEAVASADKQVLSELRRSRIQQNKLEDYLTASLTKLDSLGTQLSLLDTTVFNATRSSLLGLISYADELSYEVELSSNDSSVFWINASALSQRTDVIFQSDFHSGYSPFLEFGRYGYLDSTGAVVVDPTFEEATSFRAGFAFVKKLGKWRILNSQLEFVADFPNLEVFAAYPLDNKKFLLKGECRYVLPSDTLTKDTKKFWRSLPIVLNRDDLYPKLTEEETAVSNYIDYEAWYILDVSEWNLRRITEWQGTYVYSDEELIVLREYSGLTDFFYLFDVNGDNHMVSGFLGGVSEGIVLIGPGPHGGYAYYDYRNKRRITDFRFEENGDVFHNSLAIVCREIEARGRKNYLWKLRFGVINMRDQEIIPVVFLKVRRDRTGFICTEPGFLRRSVKVSHTGRYLSGSRRVFNKYLRDRKPS